MRNMMRVSLAMAVLLNGWMAAQAEAGTWYVNGRRGSDDNDGSCARPWRTITRAVQALGLVQSGDTVLIAPGIYREELVLRGNPDPESGIGARNTADGVTYRSAVPGRYVIVDGGALPVSNETEWRARLSSSVGGVNGVSLVYGVNDITLEGFEVRNWMNKAVDIYASSRTTFRNCRIHDAAFGVKDTRTTDTTFDGCEIFNNGVPGSNQGHGMYMGSIGLKILRCKIYNNGGVHRNRDSNGSGIEIYPYGRDIELAENMIYGNPVGVHIDNAGTAQYSDLPPGGNLLFRNNVVHSNRNRGLAVETASRGVTVYNNVLKDNNMIVFQNAPETDLSVKNNIFVNAPVVIWRTIEGSFGIFDTNAYGPRTVPFTFQSGLSGENVDGVYDFWSWRALTGMDGNSLSTTIRLTRSFGLPSRSPLIDRGTDVGLPYTGPMPDIGAFEASVRGRR